MAIFDNFKKAFSGKNNEETIKILAPMTGEARDAKECDDPVFAGEIVGKGAMIIPAEGAVYSPVDGVVSMLPDSGHALGIKSTSGLEILIHLGLDTVELKGGPFKLIASKNQEVKKGDLLLEFDIDAIKNAGLSTQSPVIVTNPDGYEISLLKTGPVSQGEELIEVRK